MRFSGHETFSIREGWLSKGLSLVAEAPECFGGSMIDAADQLGVGGNMAKSIRHWLLVSGLVEPAPGARATTQTAALNLTKVGQVIAKFDPYFLEPMTWWVVHTNLVQNESAVTTWAWFFNVFAPRRFDRTTCIEGLRRFVESTQKRVPTTRTLERDIACLLRSYARVLPAPRNEDPEEALDCPLSELGLLTHFRGSGTYALNFDPKSVPGEAFAYCLSGALPPATARRQTHDMSLQEASRVAGGPGRVFALTAEGLFDSLSATCSSASSPVRIVSVGGERLIQIEARPRHEWLSAHFETLAVETRSCHAG